MRVFGLVLSPPERAFRVVGTMKPRRSGDMEYGSDTEERGPRIQTTALSPILTSSQQMTSSSGSAMRRVTFSSTLTISSAAAKRTPSKHVDIISKRPRGLGKAEREVKAPSIADDIVLSHTSSSYELAEKGAGKVLIDSLQFNLDGLFSERAPVTLRRQSAWNLFVICKENATNVSFLRSSGVFRSLARLPGLLLTEQDQFVELILIALSLILIESDNGHVSSGVDLSSSSFQALVICSLDEKEDLRSKCRQALQVEASSSISRSGSRGTGGGGPSGLHSKRKMKRKLSSTASNAISNSTGGGAAEGDLPSDLVKTIIGNWPLLFSTVLVEQGARPTQEELGRVLALTCVSSFLMAKAQACASIRSSAGLPRGDSRKSGATADQSLARCQYVLSTPGTLKSKEKVGEGEGEGEREGEGEGEEEGDITALPLIQLYASQLVRALRSTNTQESPPSCVDRNATIWQILSVMEAFCFRNYDTKHLLSGQFRAECPAGMLHMQEELTKLLFQLGPVVKQSVKDATSGSSCSNNSSNSSCNDSPPRANALFMSELNCGAKVEAADTFSMCLKCLVNFSHDSQGTAMDSVLNAGIDVFLIDLLSFFAEQRAALADKGVLSPSLPDRPLSAMQETPIQRVIYGSMLHILALLTNLVESASQQTRREFTAVAIEDSLVQALTSTKRECKSEGKAQRSLPLLVISVLFGASRSFAADMVESSTATDATGVPPTEGGEGPIPVSDLILSAHASLLLFTLGCPSRPSHDHSQSDQADFAETAVQAVTSPEALAESASIRAALPGGTWWLLVRALKAYLALQRGTGIFLYDNLVSVLEAIRVMQLQDAVTKTHEPTDSQGAQVSSVKREAVWVGTATTPAPVPAPRVDARATPAAKKEAEGESEVETKVDWALLFSETPQTKLLEKLEQQQKEEETPSVLWQPRSREGDWLDVSGGPVLKKFGKM